MEEGVYRVFSGNTVPAIADTGVFFNANILI